MSVMGWGHDFYKVVEKRGRKADEIIRDGVGAFFYDWGMGDGWGPRCPYVPTIPMVGIVHVHEAGEDLMFCKKGDWMIGLWRQFSLGFFWGQRYVKKMRLILRMMYQILIANS